MRIPVYSMALVLVLAMFLAGGCASAAPAPPPTTAPAKPAATAPAGQPTAAPAAPTAQPTAAPKEKLSVAWSSADPAYTLLWVTKEGGFFDKNGLDVELVYMDSGAKSVQALVGGQIDLAQASGPAVIAARLGGAAVSVVATAQNTQVGEIWASKEITKPEQLRGKTWAISSFGSDSDFSARTTLKKWGLKPDQDVTILQVGAQGARLAAIEKGTAQVTTLLLPVTKQAKASGMSFMGLLSDVVGDVLSMPISAQDKFVTGREPALRKFLTALAQGAQAFKTDRPLTTQAIIKYLKYEKDAQAQADEAYDTYVKIIPPKLMPTDGGIQIILDHMDDPKAKSAKPADFVNLKVLKELDQQGLLK